MQAKNEPCDIGDECGEEGARCMVATSGGQICTGALAGDSYEVECSAVTIDNCPGLSCITLNDNYQNKTGICTALCETDDHCGKNGVCLDFERDIGKHCLSSCVSTTDCSGGFVCLPAKQDGTKVCLVETP